MVTNPLYYQRCIGGPSAPPRRHESPNRHFRLELSVRRGHLERPVLSRVAIEARRHGGVRRAGVLRGAFRYRRGELDLLRSAPGGCDSRLGGTDAPGIRVLAEAVSEVHPPPDVSRGSVEVRTRLGRIAA